MTAKIITRPKKLTQEEIRNRKEALRLRTQKRKRIILVAGCVFAIFLILVWWGVQPLRGSIQYGICKAFAELQQIYPTSMDVVQVEVFDKAMRIYYMALDPYGNMRSTMVECRFRPDSRYGLALEKVSFDFDRKPYNDQKAIAQFNKSIPAIIAANPDLRLPEPYKDTLSGLKRKNK